METKVMDLEKWHLTREVEPPRDGRPILLAVEPEDPHGSTLGIGRWNTVLQKWQLVAIWGNAEDAWEFGTRPDGYISAWRQVPIWYEVRLSFFGRMRARLARMLDAPAPDRFRIDVSDVPRPVQIGER